MSRKKKSSEPQAKSVPVNAVKSSIVDAECAASERPPIAFSEKDRELDTLVEVCRDQTRLWSRYQDNLPALCSDLRTLDDVLLRTVDNPEDRYHADGQEKDSLLRRTAEILEAISVLLSVMQTVNPIPMEPSVLRRLASDLRFLLDGMQGDDSYEAAGVHFEFEEALAESWRDTGTPLVHEIRKLEAFVAFVPEGARGGQSGNEQQTIHSEDFLCVRWYGQVYAFTTTQAGAVKCLWEAWEAGIPIVSGETLCDASGGDSDRVRGIFRGKAKEMHPAWGTMIMKNGRNSFFLQPPPADQNPA